MRMLLQQLVQSGVCPVNSVGDLADSIVTQYVRLQKEEYEDKAIVYSTEVLSLGLIWHGFHDATREEDGDRLIGDILEILTDDSSNNYNYAKEAANLLRQYHYIVSEREKAQLLWSRCVNTRGVDGANIPCDLFMEYLNGRLKTVIRSMGANVTPATIQKAGKAIAPVQHVCQIFEQQTAR